MVSEPDDESDLRNVLILGDRHRAEMRPLVTWVEGFVAQTARLFYRSDIRDVIDAFQRDEIPDFILVLQGWSDEYSAEDVKNLLSFSPLARIVMCYGAWCESDGRNQDLWPFSLRVPVWSAVPRIERDWRIINSPSDEGLLPWSASREEVFLADHLPFNKVQGLGPYESILIDSPDPAYRQFLADFLSQWGYQISECNPSMLLFDLDPWVPSRIEKLVNYRRDLPMVNCVALLACANPSMVMALRDLGVQKLVHKFGLREQIVIIPFQSE